VPASVARPRGPKSALTDGQAGQLCERAAAG
jgi:hypothetical protein